MNCKICDFTERIKFLNLKDFYLPILSNNNCESINSIYIIKCMKCKDFYYIGQTKHTKIRIKQHILDIKNFIPYIKTTSVAHILI